MAKDRLDLEFWTRVKELDPTCTTRSCSQALDGTRWMQTQLQTSRISLLASIHTELVSQEDNQ